MMPSKAKRRRTASRPAASSGSVAATRVPVTAATGGGGGAGSPGPRRARPLAAVFATMAAMKVEAAARPTAPRTRMARKSPGAAMPERHQGEEEGDDESHDDAERARFERSLPRKTAAGGAERRRARAVPVSSSFTKALERPVIAEKKRTIQRRTELTTGRSSRERRVGPTA